MRQLTSVTMFVLALLTLARQRARPRKVRFLEPARARGSSPPTKSRGTTFPAAAMRLRGDRTPTRHSSPSAKPRAVSTKYRKVLYREYTDSSFQTLKPRAPEWEHLGFLGPVIHAVVGDTIRVVFRNNGHRVFSMHPHGVFYEKSSEGVPYNDGSSARDKMDDSVPPGAHLHVHLAGTRARGSGTDGRQLGDVDVPLARERSARHRRGADGRHHRHRAQDGARGWNAEGCRSRDRRELRAGGGERQLAQGRESSAARLAAEARADPESVGGAIDLSVVQQVLDQRLRSRQHAARGADAQARRSTCDGTS